MLLYGGSGVESMSLLWADFIIQSPFLPNQRQYIEVLTIMTPECELILEQNVSNHCDCSVAMSDSLQPHGLQHARLPCPSPSPRFCSNSCPLKVSDVI